MCVDSTILSTRSDVVAWAEALLTDPHDCPKFVGASYPEEIRKLEWGSRPLWTIFSLVAGGDIQLSNEDPISSRYVQFIRDGLTEGGAHAFPLPTQETRQIVVEMQPYAYGLMACGEQLLTILDEPQREYLVAWLNAANALELPWGVWYMYRLFVNVGLRAMGLPFSEGRLEADLRAMESMYAGDGWYEDGTPFQRDYHVAFAFHGISLLMARYVVDSPIEHAVERARLFAEDFAYWYDTNGKSVPFGRSIAYRFAPAAFWSSLALVDELSDWAPRAKHILLKHLSWWREKLDGLADPLAIGYGYPNIMLGEDYSGPGSPLLAHQAFAALSLPSGSVFWESPAEAPQLASRHAEARPGMLFQVGEKHTYALSAMQYSAKSVLQRMSKYGKFCYSTSFGWNISRDVQRPENFAVDSALAISLRHSGQFVSRTRISASRVERDYVYSLWSQRDLVQVETWLVPVDEYRHVRVHKLQTAYAIDLLEGAFPVQGWDRKYDVAEMNANAALLRHGASGRASAVYDVWAAESEIALALRAAGLMELANELAVAHGREAVIVCQNPNTNLYECSLNAVPALKTSVEPGEYLLACLVLGDPGCAEDGER